MIIKQTYLYSTLEDMSLNIPYFTLKDSLIRRSKDFDKEDTWSQIKF